MRDCDQADGRGRGRLKRRLITEAPNSSIARCNADRQRLAGNLASARVSHVRTRAFMSRQQTMAVQALKRTFGFVATELFIPEPAPNRK